MNPQDAIDRSLDGQLSEEEWEALQGTLLADPELLERYVEQRWLHAQLTVESDALASLVAPEIPVARPGRPPLARLSIAAAILFFFATLYLMFQDRTAPVVATLVEATNCRWAGSELPTTEGAALTAGTLALTEGMATIHFHSGATVTLEAPTTLQIDSAMRARLIEGSVVADVPESAHGFTIDTKETEVIDLGTRFGVTTTNLGDAHVFVFDGEVKVRSGDQPDPTHLTSGKSMRLGTPGGDQPVTDQEVVRSSLPASPGDDWTAISTATGGGKDTFLRRTDPHGPTGAQPLLMVKHTDLAPGNERRAILTFDLGGVDRPGIRTARLHLRTESSGLGFSSLVPDSEFAIYGVTDDALHAWEEASLTWENGGPFIAEPLPPDFQKLGTFTIPKGSPNRLIEIESPALNDFLSTGSGPFVTLLIARETGEHDKQGLVHAFASREHPSSPPPTLWIQTEPSLSPQ